MRVSMQLRVHVQARARAIVPTRAIIKLSRSRLEVSLIELMAISVARESPTTAESRVYGEQRDRGGRNRRSQLVAA